MGKKTRFCVAPFVALNTRGHGNISVCCSILDTLGGIPKNMTVDENNLAYQKNKKDFLNEGDFYNLTKDQIEVIWNGTFYKDIRKKMLAGEYIPNCEYCYNMERNGLWSKRMGRNLHFLGDTEGEYHNNRGLKPLHKKTAKLIQETEKNSNEVKVLPQWVEVRFSTICNLRCVMCSPLLSTSIYKEYEDNYDKITDIQKNTFKFAKKLASVGHLRDSELFMSEIKKISKGALFFEFRGGEILQDVKMMAFIEELSLQDNAKEISLDITTNGIGINEGHIKIFNRFGGGKMKISIDAFGKENEYIRYPSQWKMTVKGLKTLKSLHDEWRTFVQATLSVFQAPTIHKLIEFLDEYEQIERHGLRISITKVRGKRYLEPNLVPIKLRLEAARKVENLIKTSFLCSGDEEIKIRNRESLAGLSKALNEKESSDRAELNNLFELVESFQTIRKQDFYQVFPHLKTMKKNFDLCDIDS